MCGYAAHFSHFNGKCKKNQIPTAIALGTLEKSARKRENKDRGNDRFFENGFETASKFLPEFLGKEQLRGVLITKEESGTPLDGS